MSRYHKRLASTQSSFYSLLKAGLVAWCFASSQVGAQPLEEAPCQPRRPKGGFKAVTDFSYAFDAYEGLTGDETPFKNTFQRLTWGIVDDSDVDRYGLEKCDSYSKKVFAYEVQFNGHPYRFPELNKTRLTIYEFERFFPAITLGQLAESFPNSTAVATHVFSYYKKRSRTRSYVARSDFYVSAVPLPDELPGVCYHRTEPAWNFVDRPKAFVTLDWWMEDENWRIYSSLAWLTFVTGVIALIFKLTNMTPGCPKKSAPIESYFSVEQIEQAREKQQLIAMLYSNEAVVEVLEAAANRDPFFCVICWGLLGQPDTGELVKLVSGRRWFSCGQRVSEQHLPYPLHVNGHTQHRYHPGCLLTALAGNPTDPMTRARVHPRQGSLHFVADFQAEVEQAVSAVNKAV